MSFKTYCAIFLALFRFYNSFQQKYSFHISNMWSLSSRQAWLKIYLVIFMWRQPAMHSCLFAFISYCTMSLLHIETNINIILIKARQRKNRQLLCGGQQIKSSLPGTDIWWSQDVNSFVFWVFLAFSVSHKFLQS